MPGSLESIKMTHTEAEYINAGYRYEKADNPAATRARAEVIRKMLSGEAVKDLPDARQYINQGRQEARQ